MDRVYGFDKSKSAIPVRIGDTSVSPGADYAVIAKWADGNPNNEDRRGKFVSLDSLTDGITMRIAKSYDDIRGIVTDSPAFCENARTEFFNEDNTLKNGYDYVGILGIVKAVDDGTLKANERCMPNDNGIAVKSTNNMGYQVIDRVDNDHIQVIVAPNTDMIQRIKSDVTNLQNNVDGKRFTFTGTLVAGWWSDSAPYVQGVVIPNINESDMPHITPVYSTTNSTAIAQKDAWACVSNAYAGAGIIYFSCFEDKPATDIPIQIEVNR